jgi:hypothetical protein
MSDAILFGFKRGASVISIHLTYFNRPVHIDPLIPLSSKIGPLMQNAGSSIRRFKMSIELYLSLLMQRSALKRIQYLQFHPLC